MMTALATVSSVEQKGKQYFVQLSEQQTSQRCSSQKSCGTGIAYQAVGNKSLLAIKTKKPCESGSDYVEIGFPEKSLTSLQLLFISDPTFRKIWLLALDNSCYNPYFKGRGDCYTGA